MIAPSFLLKTSALSLAMNLVRWDSEAFGFPVAQIEALQVNDAATAVSDFEKAWSWLDAGGVRLVSCRLHHERFAESFFLEGEGFRFIEMVLHPQVACLSRFGLEEPGLSVVPAAEGDLTVLTAIAEAAFGCERYHIDPRVDSDQANVRYGNWVKSCLSHPRQLLFKVIDGEQVVALFVVEFLESGKVYWHLTAVAPHLQGKGFGWRAWRAMMHYHQAQGTDSIATTISARNVRVLNLYARLGFRFLPPEMTFHYAR